MSGTVPPPPDRPDHPLWQALSRYTVGDPDAPLPFVRKLARENGWTLAEAERVFEEYRRFCYLAVTAGHEVTPSDAVDQTWHLHLTYSRDYWEHFCPEVLGRALHHGPTTGSAPEHVRYFEQYAQTLKSYEAAFGPPPADIWPDAYRRFFEDGHARRVHPRDALIVPRALLYRVLAAFVLLSAVGVLAMVVKGWI